MKKILLVMMGLFALSYGKVIEISELKKDGFVLMLGWDSNYEDALKIANKFPDDDIFIYVDNAKFTVRMVNLESLQQAKQKLQAVKKIQKDAILWKKMGWLVDELKAKGQSEATKLPTETNTTVQQKEEYISKVIVDFNSISNVLSKKLENDSQSYTAPLPLGAKAVMFAKELFIQGFFNKSTDWFIVVATSKDGATWSAISIPVWINASVLNE